MGSRTRQRIWAKDNTAPQVKNFEDETTDLKARTVSEVRFGNQVPSAAPLLPQFTQKSDLMQRFDFLYKTLLRDIDQHQEYWTTAWELSEDLYNQDGLSDYP